MGVVTGGGSGRDSWWLAVVIRWKGVGSWIEVWNAALLVYFDTFCCLLRNGKKATLFLFPCFSLFYLKKNYIYLNYLRRNK